jgi:hypothetical protein
MRWFSGVPILTNPLILKDLVVTLAILWVSVLAVVAVAQAVLGTSLGWNHIYAAAMFASYVDLSIVGAFILISIVFGNKYIVLYRFFPDAVYSETMRGRAFSLTDALHWRSFPVAPQANPRRSATKVVPWDGVRGFNAVESLRVIHLEGARGSLLRIYCPDDGVYRRSLATIESRLAIDSEQ